MLQLRLRMLWYVNIPPCDRIIWECIARFCYNCLGINHTQGTCTCASHFAYCSCWISECPCLRQPSADIFQYLKIWSMYPSQSLVSTIGLPSTFGKPHWYAMTVLLLWFHLIFYLQPDWFLCHSLTINLHQLLLLLLATGAKHCAWPAEWHCTSLVMLAMENKKNSQYQMNH